MSLKTQAKILRILQEQKFERVGGSQTTSVDVRIVAATNKDLKMEIQNGNFREDLFYRLNVIPFVVPPLRERPNDIPLLAKHFLKEFCIAHCRSLREFSEEALHVLAAYPWPGNVRELKNLVERVIILTPESEDGQRISAADLLRNLQDDTFSVRMEEQGLRDSSGDSIHMSAGGKNLNLRDARQEFEKEFILKTLKEQDWNISRTAQVLGIERSHLHRKIKSYGLEA
jgi:two-component system nitrogen regulation response regulator NtrX